MLHRVVVGSASALRRGPRVVQLASLNNRLASLKQETGKVTSSRLTLPFFYNFNGAANFNTVTNKISSKRYFSSSENTPISSSSFDQDGQTTVEKENTEGSEVVNESKSDSLSEETSDESDAAAEGFANQVLKGTCRFWNDRKGYGFVVPEDGSKDVFVHFSQIHATGFKCLSPGESVEFRLTIEGGRRRAADVTGPDGVFVQTKRRESDGDRYRPRRGDDYDDRYRSRSREGYSGYNGGSGRDHDRYRRRDDYDDDDRY